MSLPVSLEALALPRRGVMYDLSSGWWPGMPLAEGHPPFQVLTYRSPAGQRNQGDVSFLQDNPLNFGWVSELLMCTMHTGTHIDALAHTTCGPDAAWHGGHSSHTELGDFGPMSKDASELPPMVARGVSLDIPGALGVEQLESGQPVGVEQLEAACARQRVEIRRGDVALIRTGTMLHWPDVERMPVGAGLDHDGALWLAERGIAAVGGDTAVVEAQPSGRRGDPQPVHRALIFERGIPIVEWVSQEELARDGVSEFLFVCLPLSIKGATGSLVRPLAIA
ncbi:cyclase family protein [Conexibacter arvalis]|uniref:Kynurenine formamidase n=1 Tax=Conexibacter arvalis TaxID=912552 RepID=A0A840IGC3_9ACTN|nr:cyclase family protein [Conexibacter arvalis]MBB4663849.1 kynurenine formamidase [Conexibacter arvalis]